MLPNYNPTISSFPYINFTQSYSNFHTQINSYPQQFTPTNQSNNQSFDHFSFQNLSLNKQLSSYSSQIPHSPLPSKSQLNYGNNEFNIPKNINLTERHKSPTINKMFNSSQNALQSYEGNKVMTANYSLGSASGNQLQAINQNFYYKNLITKDYIFGDFKEKTIFAFARYGTRKIDKRRMILQVIMKTPQIEKDKSKILERLNRTKGLSIKNLQLIYEIYEENNSIIVCCEDLPHESLLDILDKKSLEENEVAVIVKTLLDIVYSCNKKKVPFPHINLSNIRILKLNSGIEVKLFNNGLFLFDNVIYPNDDIISEICFYSPQRCKGKCDNLFSEIWSIGILVHLLLGHKFPFEGGSVSEISANILMLNKHNLNKMLFYKYPPECYKFIEDCLKSEPIENLLVNEWLTNHLRHKDRIPIVRINDDMPISKYNLKCIFKLQLLIYTYLSINRQLFPLIEFMRCVFMQFDISQIGMVNIDTAMKQLSEFNILLSDQDMQELIEASKDIKIKKVDYILLISKFILILIGDLEISISKVFKELESSKGKIAKPFFYKIISTKYDFFNFISKLIIFDLNLNPKEYISVEDLLGTIRNKCRVKPARIFIRPRNI